MKTGELQLIVNLPNSTENNMPRKKKVVEIPVQIQTINLNQIELGVLLREIANRGWKITVETREVQKA